MLVARVWHDETSVHLVEVTGPTTRKFVTRPAEWSGFVRCSSSMASRVSRMREVVEVVRDGDYHRVVCSDRDARHSLRYRLRDEVGEDPLREWDVAPDRRFVTDHVDVEFSADVRCLFVDVECQEPGRGIDDQRAGLSRLLHVSARDMATGEEIYGETLSSWTDEAERSLVLGFWRSAKSFDVLVAWNGDGYDFPVLANRSEYLRIQGIDIVANPRFHGDLWQRWARLDQMQVDAKSRAGTDDGDTKSASTLQGVVHYRTGESKIELPTAGKRDAYYLAWRDHREWLSEYGSHDTHLQSVNERYTGYVEASLAAMRMCHCTPETRSLGPIVQGDGLVLRESLAFGHKWPTIWSTKKVGKWRGAYVHEPELIGMIDGVKVLDFAGMYPRNAASGHMSPENHEDPESDNACRLPNRAGAFRRDRRGIFPTIIDKLLDARSTYKRALKSEIPGTPGYVKLSALSAAAKIVANSIAFGITGTPASRFCDRQTFEGITTTGAWLIQRVASEAREWGAHVFAGDSDSIFTTGDEFDDDRARQFCASVNAKFPVWLTEYGWVPEDNQMELEYDEAYSRLVVSAERKRDGTFKATKKRYFCRYSMVKGQEPDPEMKHKVKGWAFRRGDARRIQREMEREFFDLILGVAGTPMPTYEEVSPELFKGWLYRWKRRVVDGDFQVDDVVRRQGLNKSFDAYKSGCTFNRGVCECGFVFKSGTKSSGPVTCPKCGASRPRKVVGPHVQVAMDRARRGDTPLLHDKISWVFLLSDDGQDRVAADADDLTDSSWVDRASVWETVYKPIRQQLVAMFPDHEWERPGLGKIRKAQHAELLPYATGLFSAHASPENDSRETVVDLGLCDAETVGFFGDVAERYVGSDVLVLCWALRLSDEETTSIRATTKTRWDSRRARCAESRLIQTGATSYKVLPI